MINLTPNPEKKKKVKDFYFRLTAVAFFILGGVTFLWVAVMLPALILSTIKKNFANAPAQLPEPAKSPDASPEALAQDLHAKLVLIEKAEADKYLASAEVVNVIVLKKGANMQIDQISFEKLPSGEKKAAVRGTAGSREELLEFRRALEGSLAFKEVNLPISNFVQGADIRFSLTLIPN
jgi:hypothetical protein